jgi:dolichol-phosphate mannosyltransferase
MKLSIVTPTYNERDNLPTLVQQLDAALKEISFELIIVDDDSPDKTWELAQKMKKEYPFIEVIHRVGEKDLSTAVMEGFKKSSGDALVVMDADLQHPPHKIVDMFNKIIDGADIVIGSRYSSGGEIEEWGLARRLYSKFATFLAHIFIPKSRVTNDPLSGFFVLRKNVIEDSKLNPTGYKILLEILAKSSYKRVEEEPITFRKREMGKSGLNIGVLKKFIFHVLHLSWQTKEIHRMAKFAFVGGIGVIVNLGILWTLTDGAGVYYLLSAIVSIEASIISNFLLNDLWTFRDRKEEGAKKWAQRLVKFNIISLPAFPMQLVVMGVLNEIFGVYYMLAAFIGILSVFIWNFVANSLWTWKKIKKEELS